VGIPCEGNIYSYCTPYPAYKAGLARCAPGQPLSAKSVPVKVWNRFNVFIAVIILIQFQGTKSAGYTIFS